MASKEQLSCVEITFLLFTNWNDESCFAPIEGQMKQYLSYLSVIKKKDLQQN